MRRMVVVIAVLVLICLAALYIWAQTQDVFRAGEAIWGYGSATDPDGDALTFTIVWVINGDEVRRVEALAGLPQTDGSQFFKDELPEGLTHKGDVVLIRVRAFDGEEYSIWGDATLTVHGWLPVVGEIHFSHEEPQPQ